MTPTEVITKEHVKGNIGDWSEWYAFLKILIERKMYAADSDLVKIENKFFDVLRIVRGEIKNGRKIYDVSDSTDFIKITDPENNYLANVPVSSIKSKIKEIFEQMKNNSDTTFTIVAAEETMNKLLCTQIKAANSQKADLTVVIHDRVASIEPELGFSIKSMLGASSTLLNASGATNFVFRIDGPISSHVEEINSIEGRSKIRDRIKAISFHKGSLFFENLDNEHFKTNLRKIDTVLPDILAELIKCFFEGKGNTLPKLVECLSRDNVLGDRYGLNKSDYEFKIKNFLVSIALGMTPSKEWDGFTKAHGGYIIVKENGEIVCYHLYNRDEFQDYLFNNTKLETPSTSKHKYGSIYTNKDSLFIKLNLQIRFLK